MVLGVICEFDPLHNGHARLLSHARALGAEAEALLALEARCTDLYVLARPDAAQGAPGQEYRTTPLMV